MALNIIFNDIFDFYTEAVLPNSTGDGLNLLTNHLNEDDPDFRGETNEIILKSKYSYKKGLDKLKELELDFNEGSNRKIYNWSDDDGDEMSTERLNEQLPFMAKRVNIHGDRNGKFINLYVNIVENAYVDSTNLLHKAHTAIQLADYLENNGYKVAIFCTCSVGGLGKYNDVYIESTYIKIQVKKPEDPLNKGLLLATISPWFFRYWLFAFFYSKFKTTWGLGHPIKTNEKDSKSEIFIHSGECLNAIQTKTKLNSIKALFNKKDDE